MNQHIMFFRFILNCQLLYIFIKAGAQVHMTWNEIFILVDLLCCGAILFPVVW